jgi:hypothetical protein
MTEKMDPNWFQFGFLQRPFFLNKKGECCWVLGCIDCQGWDAVSYDPF